MKKIKLILMLAYAITTSIDAQSFGGETISNNAFMFSPTYGDLLMRRFISDDLEWKRALVPSANKLYINYAYDFSDGVDISGNTVIGVGDNEGILIGEYADRLSWDGTGDQPGYHIRFAGYRDVAGDVVGARISALRTNICCSGLSQGMELVFFVSNGMVEDSSDDTNLDEAMRISDEGYVGIGTTTPDYKLDVIGTIRADEILVEDIAATNLSLNGNLAANNITVKANGNTADFVFADDYNLKALSEVESFIITNNHLPDMPSATQMEEQGVNLAEMNKLLLQKVEELTLYVIELKKENAAIKGEKNSLEFRLKRLEDYMLKSE